MPPLSFLLRFLGLWFLQTLVFMAAPALCGVTRYFPPPAAPSAGFLALSLMVTGAYAALATFIALRSRARGVRFFLVLFTLYFGSAGLLSQIESFVFLDQLVSILPRGVLPHIVLSVAVQAASLGLLASLLFRKRPSADLPGPMASWLPKTKAAWAIRLAIAAAVYIVLYFAFGYFVAVPIAGAEFQRFYAGLRMPDWMIPFQFMRGLAWIGIGIPLLLTHRGSRFEAALVLAVSLSVFTGLALILPNPIFTDAMRLGHLVEVTTSQFAWGLAIVAILGWGHRRNPGA